MKSESAVLETKEEIAQQDILTVAPVANLPVAQVINPMALIQMAVERDAPIEKLERLLDLRDRLEAADAKKAFDAAMASFKSTCPKITKNHRVNYETSKGVTDYRHATLDNICNTINPTLGQNGLSYMWDTQQAGGNITVTCVLSHLAGHSIKAATLTSTPDSSGGKNGIQSVGSTVTYLQRYTLLAAMGLSTENDDDDGQASGGQAGDQGDQSEGAEYYPDDKFKENLPAWQSQILEKNKAPEYVVGWIASKGVNLSPQQKNTILNTGK